MRRSQPMRRVRRRTSSRALGLTVLCTLMLFGCGAPPPDDLGPVEEADEETLRRCPETPNCVHTGNRHPEGVARMFLREGLSPSDIMPRIRDIVESMPRTTVVERSERYLHAEARSLVFRFVDDLEILVRDDDGQVVVRSASRVGRSDLGVNSGRVEDLRSRLQEAAIIR